MALNGRVQLGPAAGVLAQLRDKRVVLGAPTKLEKENEERAEGKDPKPVPPDPDLDKPIKGGPHIDDAMGER